MEKVKTIGKDFSLKQLALFSLPSILNELVISILYTIDDGFFISRYVGNNALAAFGVLSPLFMFHMASGSLFGGIAVSCSKKMGEKKDEEARRDFTTLVLYALIYGIIIGAIEYIFCDQIIYLLGATDILFPYAKDFLKIGALYNPLIMVAHVFMRFYVPAGKPHMELLNTVLNMSFNLFFDWYFVVYLLVGMKGTAYANFIAFVVQVIFGLIFYSRKNCEMRFGKPDLRNIGLLSLAFKYGLPSFISNMSVSIGTLISNYVILFYGNETFLAAYNIVMNISFAFISAFFGLFASIGPLLSYTMGERNKERLLKLFKQTIVLTSLLVVVSVVLFVTGGNMLANVFIREDTNNIRELLHYGMNIMPYSFLFFGFNVGARMCFASLGNQRSSTFLTIVQEVILSNLCIVLLPVMFGIRGVWYSFLISNILTLFVVVFVVYMNRDNYGYGKEGLALLVDR